MSYKEKVLRKENIILQVPNANIVGAVEKNKSWGEKLFMHLYSPTFHLELHYKKENELKSPFYLIV